MSHLSRTVLHVAGWSPWQELRGRPHLEFALVDLPDATGGAVYWPEGAWAAVLIDRRLPRVMRKAALAHELIHDERGGAAGWAGQPATWDDVVARDEVTVDGEVARRLVPSDELRAFIERNVGAELGVTVWEVAKEFDVPDVVAERALRELTKNPAGWDAA